jgi:hypothetical protein
VLPSHIESHLQRVHRVKQKQAKHIAEKVRGWSGLTEYASEITVPSRLPEPISQLPMYNNGLLCQLDPTRCCMVLRSADAMRKHWQRAHSWSVANKGSHPSRTVQRDIKSRADKSCRTVHCQRLFVQGQGPLCFKVWQSEEGISHHHPHSSMSKTLRLTLNANTHRPQSLKGTCMSPHLSRSSIVLQPRHKRIKRERPRRNSTRSTSRSRSRSRIRTHTRTTPAPHLAIGPPGAV